MVFTRDPDTPAQNSLFDTSAFGCWHTQLAPSAFHRLNNGMKGMFRASFLKLMPVEAIDKSFDPVTGRSTKELHAKCGIILLDLLHWLKQWHNGPDPDYGMALATASLGS